MKTATTSAGRVSVSTALSRSSAVPREPTEISVALNNYLPISSLLPFWKAGELSHQFVSLIFYGCSTRVIIYLMLHLCCFIILFAWFSFGKTAFGQGSSLAMTCKNRVTTAYCLVEVKLMNPIF